MSDMSTNQPPAATLNVESIGMLCQRFRISPRQVQEAAANLHIAPALVLNHVQHFDEQAAERIACEAARLAR